MSVELGRRIRAARKALGLTQEDIELKHGISQGLLSTYETGNREPSAEMLFRLAQALNVNPEYLLEACDGLERLTELAKRILKARVALGLKQWQLAALSDRSNVSICNYETGKYEPSARTLRKLAATLQVKSQYLLEAYKGGEGNER